MSGFVRNAWYVAAWQHEIAAGQALARTVLGTPVVLFRTADGAPVALEDRCCHRALPLSMGRVLGARIECGYHGLQFDATGACVLVPGQSSIPPGARVPCFPLVERDRLVWIWMGEQGHMDPDEIPDFHWLDHPDWRAKPSYLHIGCNHQLLIDNLLDLSHLPFVHPTTLGEMGVAETPAATERTPRGVRTVRWIVDRPPPPMLAKLGGFTGNIDRWQIVDFIAPSAVILDVGGAPTGTGAPEGDRSRGMSESQSQRHHAGDRDQPAPVLGPGTQREAHRARHHRGDARPGEDGVSRGHRLPRSPAAADRCRPRCGAHSTSTPDAAHLEARRLMDRLRAAEAG